MSSEAKRVLLMANYLKSGFTIDLNSVDAELAYYVQYFAMKRNAAEEESRFRVLFENLAKLLSKLFK